MSVQQISTLKQWATLVLLLVLSGANAHAANPDAAKSIQPTSRKSTHVALNAWCGAKHPLPSH